MGLRLRFSLRALFAALTVAGILIGWIGWNIHQVHERDVLHAATKGVTGLTPFDEADLRKPFPRLWKLLGAQPYLAIKVDQSVPEDVFRRIVELFPEAVVKQGSDDNSFPDADMDESDGKWSGPRVPNP